VLSVHIGSSGKLSIPAVDSPPDRMITSQPMNIVQAAADLLRSRPVKDYPDLKIALSEVFGEHFLTCFISDPVGVKLRHDIGIDNIAGEMDYPHSDSMWPGAPEELGAVLADDRVPDDEMNKMTYENACAGTHSTRSQTSRGRTPRWERCAGP
jgi:hypothetical protein